MGNTRDALRLIMGQLKDINQAIEFCKTYDDPELWEQLIGYSLAKPGTEKSHTCFECGAEFSFVIGSQSLSTFYCVTLVRMSIHVY